MSGQLPTPTRFNPEKETQCLILGGWVGPRDGLENLAPTGIRSPDHPARSESLYRLRYPLLYITFL